MSSDLTPNSMYFDQAEEMKYVYMLGGSIRLPPPPQSSTNKHPPLNCSQPLSALSSL